MSVLRKAIGYATYTLRRFLFSRKPSATFACRCSSVVGFRRSSHWLRPQIGYRRTQPPRLHLQRREQREVGLEEVRSLRIQSRPGRVGESWEERRSAVVRTVHCRKMPAQSGTEWVLVHSSLGVAASRVACRNLKNGQTSSDTESKHTYGWLT